MPYRSPSDLPERVRQVLPEEAREIYLQAFNSAWNQYQDPGERRNHASLEQTAHKVAWAAVKKKFRKDEPSGQWKLK